MDRGVGVVACGLAEGGEGVEWGGCCYGWMGGEEERRTEKERK